MGTSRRTGYAELPLHGGKAPRWLFQRMVRLSREIALTVLEKTVQRAGVERSEKVEALRRLALFARDAALPPVAGEELLHN